MICSTLRLGCCAWGFFLGSSAGCLMVRPVAFTMLQVNYRQAGREASGRAFAQRQLLH